jgi:hypothetical protein
MENQPPAGSFKQLAYRFEFRSFEPFFTEQVRAHLEDDLTLGMGIAEMRKIRA